MGNNLIKAKVRSFVASQGYTLSEIVDKINLQHPGEKATTIQSLSNKLTRGTIRFSEIMEIADILGFSVEFIPKGSPKAYFPKSEERQRQELSLSDQAYLGQFVVRGKNFGDIVVLGENAELAAAWLAEMLKENPSKADEIKLHMDARRHFDVTVHATNKQKK